MDDGRERGDLLELLELSLMGGDGTMSGSEEVSGIVDRFGCVLLWDYSSPEWVVDSGWQRCWPHGILNGDILIAWNCIGGLLEGIIRRMI